MKMSCNGCRILRKGCSEDCVIRPCLEWINCPKAQANATLFLAKFYGRAGLVNLINAAPQHLRPGVLKSLMYEACGRIANPTYGSLGLFWTGEWAQCQAAVDAVLSGAQINVVESSHSQVIGARGNKHVPSVLGISHVSKVKGKGKLKRTENVIMPKPRVGSVNSVALWKPTSSHDLRGSKGDNEEIMEALLVSQDKPSQNGGAKLDLELTLG
ncbi:LOB domain-containing protein 41 [Mucuna pruriens]|uniref:LOB domain-containing protein 41 n=1 Tax=Mucuna pruriens TaxID=157652 RepID=A0A371HHK8_MUCPR|nr:LOB domain-containing protein 41 [Mucuna pruriens]